MSAEASLNIDQLVYHYNPAGHINPSETRVIQLGRFVGASYESLLPEITKVVEAKYNEALEFWQVKGRWPAHIQELIEQKRAQVASFQKYVEELEKENADKAEKVRTGYALADKASQGENTEKQIAARLATLDGVRRVFDVDGTLTKDPDQYLRSLIPGGRVVEDRLDSLGSKDPLSLVDVFAITHQDVYKEAFPMWRWAGSHPKVDLREGVDSFFDSFTGSKALITCSCPEFAAGVLDKIANPGQVEIWGVDDYRSVAVRKNKVIKLLMLRDLSRPLSYTGDGSSDTQALSPDVAYYYALEGKGFEKALLQGGYLYLPYRTFDDIKDSELKIAELREKS